MTNTVTLVIESLINAITDFLQTDIAMVFCGVIITALVIRILCMIFHINKKGRRYN